MVIMAGRIVKIRPLFLKGGFVMNKWANQEIVIGVVIFIFSLVLFFLSLGVRGEASVFPIGLSILLVFLSSFIVIRGIRIRKKGEKAANMQEEEEEVLRWEILESPLVVALLTLIYILLITFIGFFPSTIIFFIAYLLYMGIKGIAKYVLIISIFSTFIYIVFIVQLRVFLPSGLLFD